MRACAVCTFDQRTTPSSRSTFQVVARGRERLGSLDCLRVVVMDPRAPTGGWVLRAGCRSSLPTLTGGFAALRRVGLPALRPAILFLNPGVDLFAMHLHFGRGFDAELHLARANLEHGDLHRIPDPNVLS